MRAVAPKKKMAYVTEEVMLYRVGQIVMNCSPYARGFSCILQVLSHNFYVRGLRKATKTISRDNPSQGRHFESRISEYMMEPLYHNDWLQTFPSS
jgi:hypothetical protein